MQSSRKIWLECISVTASRKPKIAQHGPGMMMYGGALYWHLATNISERRKAVILCERELLCFFRMVLE